MYVFTQNAGYTEPGPANPNILSYLARARVRVCESQSLCQYKLKRAVLQTGKQTGAAAPPCKGDGTDIPRLVGETVYTGEQEKMYTGRCAIL